MTTKMPSSNVLKSKLESGQPVFGIWSVIPSATVAEIMGLSGLDFAILDMEHGMFDMATLDACIRAVEIAGSTPLVRLPGANAYAAQWALDMGAHGIVVPQVNDASEARSVVGSAKFSPAGFRGYNPFTRAAEYANPPDNRTGKLDDTFSLTCVIVESTRSLDELDAICATPGLDVVYVGIYDLSVAMGCNGNTRHPTVVAAAESAVTRIRAAGKAAGMMVRNAADIERALAIGANFLVHGVDTALIREAAITAVAAFGKELAKRPATPTIADIGDPT